MRKVLIVLMLVFAVSPAAQADLKQYIDEQTLLAAEVDLAKLDLAATEAWARQLLTTSGLVGPKGVIPQAEIDPAIAQAKRWITEFQKAGGRRIYFVTNFGLIQRGNIALVLPAEAGGDPKKLASLVHHGKADGAAPGREADPGRTEIINGNVAVVGRQQGVAYVKALKPSPRADLNAALAVLGDAPVKVVVSPPQMVRALAMGSMPQTLYDQPSSAVARDLQWVAASMTLPPTPVINATARSADLNSAKALHQIITYALAEASGVPPTISPDFAKLITPTLNGEQITLSLTNEKIAAAAKELALPLAEARRNAHRVAAMSNMRQILMAGHMHAAENKGKWPEDLKGLQKYLPNMQRVNVNPRQPELKDPFIYIKPANTRGNANDKMVLYESHKEFGNGVNVGFLDGHVEFVQDKARFDDLLAQTAVDQPAQ